MQRRYHTLDGLRGVAAIVVCLGHSRLWLTPLPVPRGWLAVDLFFILSGFVIAKAYDGRFAQGMTAKQFLLQRYLRLYPIYLAGLCIGFVSAALTMALSHGAMTGLELTLATASGLLMLPSPTWGSISDIAPLNHPAWSLLYEIGVNILFASVWRWLQPPILLAVVGASALTLMGFHFYADGFAGPNWAHAWMGIPRTSFGFFLRVLISRNYNQKAVMTEWAWAFPLILIAILYGYQSTGAMMFSPAAKLFDATMVFLGFPILIIIGAKYETASSKIFGVLGFISYALYAVHEPALYLAWRVVLKFGKSPTEFTPAIGLAFVALIITFSFILAKADARFQKFAVPWLRRRERRPVPEGLSTSS